MYYINYRNTRYRYLIKLKTCILYSIYLLFDIVMTTHGTCTGSIHVHVFLKDFLLCVHKL